MASSISQQPPPESTQECPGCHAQASGRFCSECGTVLQTAACLGCHTDLTSGAKFCHRCGLPVGTAVPAGEARSFASALPWAVAAIAIVSLIAVFVGQSMGGRGGDATIADASIGAGTTGAAVPAAGASTADPAIANCAGGPAPNINGMSPDEQASRLFDKVIGFSQQGRQDCVEAFLPMALAAYEALPSLDLGAHYEIGRIGEVSGDAALAKAEADSILKRDPTHLLGLILAAHAAHMLSDATGERSYYRRFLAAEPAERAKSLPEYSAHANDIAAANSTAGAPK